MLDEFTIEQNKEEAKRIAEEYIKKLRETQRGVSDGYLYAIRDGTFAGALIALNKLAAEINYLRHGGKL